MAKTATPKKPLAREAEILVLPEEGLTLSDRPSIESFLRGLAPFFRKAQDLELASRQALERAELIQSPRTPQDDEAIQVEIKGNTAGRKALTGHWGDVTSLFHGFHRRLTSARSRGEGNYDTANGRLQSFHNAFVDAARRKAALEQEVARRAAEAAAQAERDAELQRLEDEAVKAEASSADLSEREALFVDYLTEGMVPYQAANRAGFKDGVKAAARLTALPKIQAAIAAKQEAKRIREQKQAVAESPVIVRHEEVRLDVRKAAGASDRTYFHADILDADAFVKAALAGTYGIPAAALLPNQSWLNEQAKAIQGEIERYPGIRFRKTTKTV